jgi:potassium voltage-gated channel Shaker-related subfamily A protein 6
MLPDSTLGNHFKRENFYDAKNDVYFLDRHKKSFEVVIDFYFSNHYKSQGLLRPIDIPLDIFIEELRFYELPIPVILDFLESEGIEVIDITYKGKPWSYHVWQFLESPKYSQKSSILHHFNTVMIISM